MTAAGIGRIGGCVALALFAFANGFGSAQAQVQKQAGFEIPVCEGELSSFPLGDIPTGERYWVDIFDPTDEALAFREIFLKALRDSGRATGENARMVFNFESQSSYLGLVPQAAAPTVGPGTTGSRDPGTQAGVSELRDTIRGDRRGRDGPSGASTKIDAKAELRDTQTGKVVWLVTVACRPLTADRRLLMEFVSTKIVERLGFGGGTTKFE
jgi:hypothetical protein